MLYVLSSYLTSIYQYVKDEIKDGTVILDDVLEYPYHSKIKQWARRFLIGRIPLPANLLLSLLKCGEKEKKCLRNIHPQDTILICDVYNLRVCKALLNLFPKKCRVYIYFSNPVERLFNNPLKELNKLRRKGVVCCSFDRCESEKYSMQMAGQYSYINKLNIYCEGECRQAFFCGLEKDRAEEIAHIKSFLQDHRIQCDFLVPKRNNEMINYKQDYLARLSKAGIVVDINQKGQKGLTRRPIEALLWNKKLVTNNRDIVNYDFYRPENIFVYGVDDPCGFEHFVETPLAEIPGNIKSRYTVAGWLEQFS